MKKSHRKDVIIARIIFGILVVIIVALVALMITMIARRNANKISNTEPKASESEYVPAVTEPDTTTVPSEDTQATETESETESEGAKQVWVTGEKVRIRKAASTSSEILAEASKTDTIMLLEETEINNFYKVERNGTIGYIHKDYITFTNPN